LLTTSTGEPHPRTEGTLQVQEFRRDWPAAFCPSSGLRNHLRGVRADIIHHHSLWLRTLEYARGRARTTRTPLVISPRGMMSRWAWNHHALRKRLASLLVHPGALKAAQGWHATSPEEADDIRSHGFTQPICMAPNGVTAPTVAARSAALDFWRKACPDTAHRPTALFYSRFHPKKRVLELIDLWLEQAPADWLLLMVGLPEEYTAAQLEAYVMRASCAGRIQVFNGEGLPAPYAAADLFLLPSHSENFGLVVAEAMANGLPILVTDTTPWKAVNENQAGWCVPWADFPAALREALAESEARRAERGRTAHTYALTDFSWDESARKLSEFYVELTRGRTR
jgi:glycosyltransferase involved in cell wall biosynthesis